MDNKNIRVIFTDKADLVLEEMVNKFNLENTEESAKRIIEGKTTKPVALSRIISDFKKGSTTEKDLLDLLQKNLEISLSTSQELSKEINKILPLLETFPEEKFADPNFREEISEKNEGPMLSKSKEALYNKQPVEIKEVSKNENDEEIDKNMDLENKNQSEDQKPEKTLPKKIIKEKSKQTGSDKYRESVN